MLSPVLNYRWRSRVTSLLDVQDLVVTYGHGSRVHEALKGVSLTIRRGETLGLVGESGSGKTTLGRAVLGLVRPTSGLITFAGADITWLRPRQRRGLAGDLQVVFQDPYSSLDPSMRVCDILIEPLRARGVRKREATGQARDLLDRVGMPVSALDRFPREFSGGQRQRIAIARALILDPKLIVCDEPVSALDLSTQRKVLDLFLELQERTGVAYLFISHDLAVIRHVSHQVAVLYQGCIVEHGATAQVTGHPQHPYTQRLWAAHLVADPLEQSARRGRRKALQVVTP
jgi:ABC-type glutathione transport system ATPase component